MVGTMPVRVLEPRSITIETTNRCTAACRHCNMRSGPDRGGTLSWDQLRHIINEVFSELDEIDVVVFAGGEPTLLGADLHKAIALCKEHGAVTRIVTNAFWATSPEAAQATVAELRAAGLDELNISTDDYHLPFISLQRLRWAFEAAFEAGFMSVALANCAGPQSWLTAERLDQGFGQAAMHRRYDPDGNLNEQRWALGETMLMLSNAKVQRIGRGIDRIQDSELPPLEAGESLADYGGCPWALRSAAISPSGHLLSCCGFELEDNPILDYGDLNERPLSELLDRADGDLITNMIAILGPPRIKEILEQHWPDEVSFPRTYNSYCEVCSDLVGVEQNRRALYRYQASFLETVMQTREQLTADFSDGERVRLPADLLILPTPAPDGQPDAEREAHGQP